MGETGLCKQGEKSVFIINHNALIAEPPAKTLEVFL